MRILIISDGHGDIEKLDALADEFKKADFVLFGGDFAEFGKLYTGEPYLKKLISMHKKIFAVTGNCDSPQFVQSLEETNINVEKKLSYYNELVISGSGGALKFTGLTPNEREDKDLVKDLDFVVHAVSKEKKSCDNVIIIAHNPPKDTKLDIVKAGFHVGSSLLRAFIETHKPLLVVSGHIHESAAIDYIDETCLVNPGALFEGRYAIAQISKGNKKAFEINNIELKHL